MWSRWGKLAFWGVILWIVCAVAAPAIVANVLFFVVIALIVIAVVQWLRLRGA